ncbi:hypothetical protein GCG21_05605 [Pseudactinotalea sp. HY160]|uniref:HNH endonuclease signature motif containing protein n=1 Tax=Pseudactinotalea sp. HY160 TaxID=2654490 RepID=UPI00128DF7A6|nr:HNH endonuclease signature motif containing protein [Pseudactinotalea sp. HY160]MPV49485.1 hypothetical protein [Pseudactinotalea sp. HY160]
MSTKAARQMRARRAEIASIASEDAVLDRVRQVRKVQAGAEADLFFLAIEIAQRSPVTEECGAWSCHTDLALGVSYCDSAANWFAAVTGFSTDAAQAMLLEALEVAERLPLLYGRVLDGRTRAHTARLVAEQTLGLTVEAAGFVDVQVAAAGAIRGRYAIKSLVREAMITHMPDQYAHLQRAQADPRRADVHIGTDGTGRIDAIVSTFAALDLEQSLTFGAAQLKAAGSGEVLDTRRSLTFEGIIAATHHPEPARQDGFDLTSGQPGQQAQQTQQAQQAQQAQAPGAGAPDWANSTGGTGGTGGTVGIGGAGGMAAAAVVDLTPDEAAGQFDGPSVSTAAAPATSTAAGPAGSAAVGSAGSAAVGSAAGTAVGEAAAADPTGEAPATVTGRGVSCGPARSGRGVPRAKVVMYLHMNASAFWPDGRPPDQPCGPPRDHSDHGPGHHPGGPPPDHLGGPPPDHPGGRSPDHPDRDPGGRPHCHPGGLSDDGSYADPPGTGCLEHAAGSTGTAAAAGAVDPEHAADAAYVAGRLSREPVRIEGPGIPPGLVITAAEVAAMFTTPHDAAMPGRAGGSGAAHGPGGSGGPWGPQVFVRPVIDLETEHEVAGYAAGDVIKDHLHLRDRTCVFPNCARPARACDADHIDPWKTDPQGDPVGGPTCTCNLASLCRRHHRWKTHNHPGQPQGRGSWSYVMLGPGTYYWSGPMGLRFLRTPTGTTEVTDQAWHRHDLAALPDLHDLQGLQDFNGRQGLGAVPGREPHPDHPARPDQPALPGHESLPGLETLPGLEAHTVLEAHTDLGARTDLEGHAEQPDRSDIEASPDSRARRDDLDEAFMDALDYEYGNADSDVEPSEADLEAILANRSSQPPSV